MQEPGTRRIAIVFAKTSGWCWGVAANAKGRSTRRRSRCAEGHRPLVGDHACDAEQVADIRLKGLERVAVKCTARPHSGPGDRRRSGAAPAGAREREAGVRGHGPHRPGRAVVDPERTSGTPTSGDPVVIGNRLQSPARRSGRGGSLAYLRIVGTNAGEDKGDAMSATTVGEFGGRPCPGGHGSVENAPLVWLAARMPRRIESDHCRLGFAATLAAGLMYAAERGPSVMVLLVNLALVANWFGDSLDGTLARFRGRSRPATASTSITSWTPSAWWPSSWVSGPPASGFDGRGRRARGLHVLSIQMFTGHLHAGPLQDRVRRPGRHRVAHRPRTLKRKRSSCGRGRCPSVSACSTSPAVVVTAGLVMPLRYRRSGTRSGCATRKRSRP